jgi:hypothetical protein
LAVLLPMTILSALLAWLAAGPERKGSVLRQPSTFFNVEYGAKAAYLLFERLGYQVGQLRRPIDVHSLSPYQGLVMLGARVPVSDAETSTLRAWVSSGHVLLVVPDHFLLDEWFPRTPAAPGSQARLDPSDPICQDIRELETQSNARLSAEVDRPGALGEVSVHRFWEDSAGSIGMRVSCGSGSIIALAAAFPLTNEGIQRQDNVLLAANLARELAGPAGQGTIGFDEYHLGFAERDPSALAILKLMFADDWGWAIAQAALAGAAALGAGAVRFGQPVDVTRRQRRHHLEFAKAAGHLLHQARAWDLTLRTLVAHYRAQLCQLAGLPVNVDDAALAHVVKDRTGLNVTQFLEGVRSQHRVNQHDLIVVANSLHAAAERMKHGP